MKRPPIDIEGPHHGDWKTDAGFLATVSIGLCLLAFLVWLVVKHWPWEWPWPWHWR